MLPKSKLALDVFKAVEFLYEQAQQPSPQANIANTNPMQPLPGQAQQQNQVVGSSGGQPMSSTGEPVNIDVIIDRLNVIRGGKSFNEPDVYGQITTLFNSLPENEKVSLESFLTKMGELVTGPDQNVQQQAVNARTTQAPMSPPAAPQQGTGAAATTATPAAGGAQAV